MDDLESALRRELAAIGRDQLIERVVRLERERERLLASLRDAYVLVLDCDAAVDATMAAVLDPDKAEWEARFDQWVADGCEGDMPRRDKPAPESEGT